LAQFENHPNYNCKITLESGEQYNVYADWLHNNGLDHWKGWQCNEGHTRFFIDANFEIWGSECRNTLLGNVLGTWDTKSNSICTRNTCTACTDDLMTSKHKIQDLSNRSDD
jgi:hypothetical protein